MMENLSEASGDGRIVFSAPSSDQKRFHFRFVVSCLVVGIAAAIAFTLYSDVDLVVAGWFREDDGVFVFQRGNGRIARKFFMWGFTAAVVLSVVGAFRGFWFKRPTFELPAVAWIYLIACFIAGPLVLTNVVLKDNWGRARPKQVEMLGGTKSFTPALQPSDQCERNCSFISGEASSIFMLFFAAAFLLPLFQHQLALGGIIMGSLAGLLRMGAGGHFLSDVVFAGVFMALTAFAIYCVFGWRLRASQPDD